MTDPRFADALARLPDYLGSHVLVSLTAMALGLAVSLPLAILSVRRKRLRATLLGAASIVQTIPGLALLTLFYPLLLALAALSERLTGHGFSALGFLPAVLALALYSMLPILRNTVTGLTGIGAGLHDAARALGMRPAQTLWLVDLPVAAPIVMAGIRTAAVWVIGTATLSTPIGQASLGNYIFSGLQTQNWVFVLFGCFAAAALALFVDRMLALIEYGVAIHDRRRVALASAGLLLLLLAALVPRFGHARADYVIGAKPFTEQIILSALIKQRIGAGGHSAVQREDLGSSIAFNALAANEIDAYVDYSGTIWTNVMQRHDTLPRAQMLAEIERWLKDTHGIAMPGALGFENAYALAMSRKRAQALGIATIADLVRAGPGLSIAGDYEFFSRPEWKAIRDTYGLRFGQERTMQSTFMYAAATSGEVDVIAAYSSDGRIVRDDLLVLGDPKAAVPPYDAVLMVSPRRANDPVLTAALRPLIGAIDVTLMRQANLRTDRPDNPQTTDDAARWLWERIATKKPAP